MNQLRKVNLSKMKLCCCAERVWRAVKGESKEESKGMML